MRNKEANKAAGNKAAGNKADRNKADRNKADRNKANRNKADRKEQILEATLEVVALEGVAAITHRRIAEAAGVPLGSTTYYFDSLEQLLREAFVHHIARAKQIYDATAAAQPVTDSESFAEYLAAVSTREFASGSFLLGEYELTLFAARDDQVAQALANWDESMVASLAKTLDQIGVSVPFTAAKTLLHLMRGHELESLTRQTMDVAALKNRLVLVIRAYQ